MPIFPLTDWDLTVGIWQLGVLEILRRRKIKPTTNSTVSTHDLGYQQVPQSVQERRHRCNAGWLGWVATTDALSQAAATVTPIGKISPFVTRLEGDTPPLTASTNDSTLFQQPTTNQHQLQRRPYTDNYTVSHKNKTLDLDNFANNFVRCN